MPRHRLHALAFAACFLAGVPCGAQTITPSVVASIHDEPRDGLGDSFNTSPFTGLLREQTSREDRAVHEFDLTSLIGQSISSAVLSGRVSVNNAANVGVRTFDFLIYAGNGVADLTDFEIPANLVGSGSYHPPMDTFFDYTFDVTSAVQGLLANGVGFTGLKVDCTSDPNFPNILSASMSQLVVQVAVPASSTPVGAGCGLQAVPPQLAITPPVLGGTTTLSVSITTPGTPGTLFGAPGQSVSIPLGTTGCTAFVDPLQALPFFPFVTDGSGSWSTSLALPSDPSLAGLTVTFQALLSPTPSLHGFDLTNGVTVVLGL